MDEIEKVLSVLELAVRGRCTAANEAELHTMSLTLLEKSSVEEVPPDMPDSSKTKMVNTAVLLHNKVRNLSTNGVYKEIKSIIRAASAWMLSKYGQKTQKVLCTCIKLHTRCATELSSLKGDSVLLFSRRSLDEALANWEALNIDALEQSVTMPELEELRMAVYHAYITRGKALTQAMEMHKDAQSESSVAPAVAIPSTLNNASEVFQSLLPTCAEAGQLRARFVECITEIGTRLMALQHADEATTAAIFAMALRVADITSSQLKPTDQMRRCKYRIYSALAYAHGQQHRYDRALDCISRAEELIMQLRRTATDDPVAVASTNTHKSATAFSKLYFLCKSGDVTAAQGYLDQVLAAPETAESTTLHSTHLKMVGMLCDSSQTSTDKEGTRAHQFHAQNMKNFSTLLELYPNSPEFNTTRLGKLRYLAASENSSLDAQDAVNQCIDSTTDTETSTSLSALSLSGAIIRDHESGAHSLTPNHAATLQQVLLCAVTFHLSTNNYKQALCWSTIGLLIAELGGGKETLLLQHTEALLYTGKFEEAMACANASCQLHATASGLQLLFFTTLYHTTSADRALAALQSQLRKEQEESSDASVTLGMSCILQCYRALDRTTSDVPNSPEGLSLSAVRAALLQSLLEAYESYHMTHKKFPRLGGPDQSCSYLAALCNLIQGFLNQHTEQVQVPGSEDRKRKFATISGAPAEVSDVDREVYSPVRSLTLLLRHAPLGAEGLGTCADMEWILTAAFHVGGQLMAELSEKEPGERETYERTEMAAKMFELVQDLELATETPTETIEKDSNAPQQQRSIRRVQSLLFASTLRLDLDAMAPPIPARREGSPDHTHLNIACRNIQTATEILTSGTPGTPIAVECQETTETQWRGLQANALSLELILRSRRGPPTDSPSDTLSEFISANISKFQLFLAKDLEALVAVCQAEPHSTLPAIRNLLKIALTVSLEPSSNSGEEEPSHHEETCRLYNRVVSLSATRQQALENVESFEKYCQGMKKCSLSGADLSNTDPYIEAVAIGAYNNAVVLMELGQHDLAERFACKVISLQQHLTNSCGSTLAQWQNCIQETYLALLKLKREGAVGAIMETPHAAEDAINCKEVEPTACGAIATKKDISLSLAALMT